MLPTTCYGGREKVGMATCDMGTLAEQLKFSLFGRGGCILTLQTSGLLTTDGLVGTDVVAGEEHSQLSDVQPQGDRVWRVIWGRHCKQRTSQAREESLGKQDIMV